MVGHSLEAIISKHEGTAIVKDIRGEIDALVRRLYPAVDAGCGKSRGRLRPGDRKSAREEVSTSAAAWSIVSFYWCNPKFTHLVEGNVPELLIRDVFVAVNSWNRSTCRAVSDVELEYPSRGGSNFCLCWIVFGS